MTAERRGPGGDAVRKRLMAGAGLALPDLARRSIAVDAESRTFTAMPGPAPTPPSCSSSTVVEARGSAWPH